MGREVLRLAPESGFRVIGGLEHRGHPALRSDWDPSWRAPGILVDFSTREAVPSAARLAAESGFGLVSGTTGLGDAEMAALAEAAERVAVLHAPNMSLGAMWLTRLVEETARALTEGWDVEVVELHHRAKRDAPSGTALGLVEAVERARGGPAPRRHGRSGAGEGRPAEEIGVHALRGGGRVGRHEVHWLSTEETVTLCHEAHSRSAFARGALAAARWLAADRSPRLYTLADVTAGASRTGVET
jgi:4-hydroxy-tetrahydrodipicolinate reductase